MTLTFGSLFSGIGGIDLGLERAGMRCVWQSEIDPYASRVLQKHWPDTPNLGDIRGINWANVERPDVVAGGYPCQPFSIAGRHKGTDDPKHLWPHFANCLRALRPRYALLENVSNHLTLGFGHVLADLAEIGYDARWDCLPAASVGAPHLRDRLFVIARLQRTKQRRALADSNDAGSCDPLQTGWDAPWNGGTDDGRAKWTTEPDVGRVAYGVPSRVDRLRGLGNSVVPQVAEHVGRIIMDRHT